MLALDDFLTMVDGADDWASAHVLDMADASISYLSTTILAQEQVADVIVSCVSTRLATTALAPVAESCARVLSTLLPAARVLDRSLALREELASALPRWPGCPAVAALGRQLLLTAPYAGQREAAATCIQRHWRGHRTRAHIDVKVSTLSFVC